MTSALCLFLEIHNNREWGIGAYALMSEAIVCGPLSNRVGSIGTLLDGYSLKGDKLAPVLPNPSTRDRGFLGKGPNQRRLFFGFGVGYDCCDRESSGVCAADA